MTQINSENIASSLKDILALDSYIDLNNKEKLLTLSNLILIYCNENMTDKYKPYSTSLLNSGKEIALELQKNPNDIILQIALKAHLLIDLANKT